MKSATLPFALLSLAACAATVPAPFDERGNPNTREPQGHCDAELVQGLIGARVDEDMGAQLLELSGARTLRWVPPRTAITMDFRPDRLTVSYDDEMIIERITCG